MIGRLEEICVRRLKALFGHKNSGNLEPLELIQGLTKKVNQSAAHYTGELLPNAYIFSLGKDDYYRLSSHRVIDELIVALKKHIITANRFMEGKLRIDFTLDEAIPSGAYTLKMIFERQHLEPRKDMTDEAIGGNTIVLERPKLREPRVLNLPKIHSFAKLVVIDGADSDSQLELGEKKIYLGRLDRNEFMLQDSNVSRLHAWISYEQHRHVLYDADSRNGTYVDGERIDSCVLCDGDEIVIGSTKLRYEVA